MSENPYEAPKAHLSDPAETGPVQLASRGKRLLGAIIDGLIGSAVAVVFLFAMGYWEEILNQNLTVSDAFLFAVVGFVSFLIIHGYTLSRSGQTLGKVWVKTQIVSVRTNKPLSLGHVAGLRYLPTSIAAQIPIIGPLFNIVNVLFIFRSDHRCIHDLIAGTKVIEYRSPSHPS